MAALTWDGTGNKIYETGVDRGVLYIPDDKGVYSTGVAWNGLTTVTESPSGAESNPQYADNLKYLNLYSAEEFGATIEAFTYPAEFEQCNGMSSMATGVFIGQQSRKSFGFSYRTLLGNDIKNTSYGYKIHIIYGAMAAPSEAAYASVNDSPEAISFSWEITTTPVSVPGFSPTASLVINSTKITPEGLKAVEAALYGGTASPRLPLPDEIAKLAVTKTA